jgi:hypothetical protein
MMTQVIYLLFLFVFLWLGILTYFFFFRKKPHRVTDNKSGGRFRFNLVRFNPFSDTGGEQSFVVSLLDGGGNGILLTSLHGRGVTRIYAKKVTAGKADQELSSEEKLALKEAINDSQINNEQ